MATHRLERRPRLAGGRPPRRGVAALSVLLAVAGTTWFSGATFTSSTDTPVTVRAAADYHPPKVSLAQPGSVVTGTVTLAATASDTGSGVASVRIERAPVGGGTWTAVCTLAAAPYSCAWDTTKVADADYQLRAVATDAAGFSAVSALVTTRVANAAAVELTTVPDVIRGTRTLSATVLGAGQRSAASAFQYRLSGATGAWSTICASVAGTAPTCSWNTTPVASDVYDLQVTTTLGSGTTTVVTDVQTDVTVDNTPPAVALTAPSPLTGTALLTASASDEDSGVDKVVFEYRTSAVGTWTTICTTSVDPYRCFFDTTRLTVSTVDLRAVATDAAGNSAASAVVTRTVSNTTPSVTITSPVSGDLVRGTTTVTADTSASASISSVTFAARAAGTSTWTTVCVDPTAPYACDWATGSLASGTWELRAQMTYGNPSSVATSPVVSVTVDNNPLRALDIQAANGGTAGRADAGDTLTFTYAGAVDLTTVKAGWTGARTDLTVVMSDRNVNPATTTDRATFSGAALGQVTFAQNYVRKNRSVTIAATMTASTATVDGVTTTTIVVTLGAITSRDLLTATGAGTMRWTPVATVRSTTGAASSTTTAAESGALDADL